MLLKIVGAQGMSVAQIARLAYSEDRVATCCTTNATASAPVPATRAGGRDITLAERREIKKIAKSAASTSCRFPVELASSRIPGREGVVEDISHEGLRELLRAENVHRP